MRVEVIPAERDEMAVLGNLLELYIYDFSEYDGMDIGEDGRYGYRYLSAYWEEPERRPFFIRVDGVLAGFALVKKGATVVDDPEVNDIAEFFVLRKYRRRGVGRASAWQIWDRFPGKWIVRVMNQNKEALRFWAKAIEVYTGGEFNQAEVDDGKRSWIIYQFSNRGDHSGNTSAY